MLIFSLLQPKRSNIGIRHVEPFLKNWDNDQTSKFWDRFVFAAA